MNCLHTIKQITGFTGYFVNLKDYLILGNTKGLIQGAIPPKTMKVVFTEDGKTKMSTFFNSAGSGEDNFLTRYILVLS